VTDTQTASKTDRQQRPCNAQRQCVTRVKIMKEQQMQSTVSKYLQTIQ